MTALAIIIPYYKKNFFRETLLSLAQQTDMRFTVYVVNDASPFDPSAILKDFDSVLDVRYYSFENNLGGKSLVKQWNRCIGLIGDTRWFMILGDDDCLSSNVVAAFYEEYNEFSKTSCVIRYSTRLIDEKGDNLSEIFTHPKWEFPLDFYCRKLTGQTRSSLSEYIFSWESYNKYGFKDYALAWGTDDRAVVDFADRKPIYSLSPVVQVRMSGINISSKSDDFQIKIPARQQTIKEILIDYRKELKFQQKLDLLGGFEYQYYRNSKTTLEDTFFLFFNSYRYKGFRYTINQLKSVLKRYKR